MFYICKKNYYVNFLKDVIDLSSCSMASAHGNTVHSQFSTHLTAIPSCSRLLCGPFWVIQCCSGAQDRLQAYVTSSHPEPHASSVLDLMLIVTIFPFFVILEQGILNFILYWVPQITQLILLALKLGFQRDEDAVWTIKKKIFLSISDKPMIDFLVTI